MQIAVSVYFLAAFFLLVLPLDWFLSAAAAAVFHELCHILVLYGLQGKMIRIQVGVRGCVMETDRIEEKKQFLSIVAGPLGSFSLVLWCRVMPKLAICGLFHGLYNMIPLLPLDGGRLLQLFLQRYFPDQAQRVMDLTAVGICILILLGGIWFSAVVLEEIWPLLLAFVWVIKALPRKNPCKPLLF